MPRGPSYTVDDIRHALLNLLPRGRVWRRDPDSTFYKLMGALAPTYVRNVNTANDLLVDTVPTTTSNLLEEWESSLGLPDACSPGIQTVAQREAEVGAKWAARGGQSQVYFIKLAAALGYPISITTFAPSRFGRGFGQPFGGQAWAHAWQINAPTITIQRFKFGAGGFGDPFSSYGNTTLQCRITQLAPAHTQPFFKYT